MGYDQVFIRLRITESLDNQDKAGGSTLRSQLENTMPQILVMENNFVSENVVSVKIIATPVIS